MAASGDSVQRILGSSSDADCDDPKMELLGELQRGRPVTDLLPLLRASNSSAAKAGVWIASELGASGRPLLTEVVPLLGHTEPTVRFFVLECVLLWASPTDALALSAAVALLEDASAAVRWKAMQLLSRASDLQLAAARTGLGGTRHRDLLSWLLADDGRAPAEVIATLDSTDPLVRRYAAIAAAGLAGEDRTPLVTPPRARTPR